MAPLIQFRVIQNTNALMTTPCFPEMWYGVFLWAAVSSLVFHLPAALLALATLRQHKIARFMPIAILLMGIVGPICGGVLTSEFVLCTMEVTCCPPSLFKSILAVTCLPLFQSTLFCITLLYQCTFFVRITLSASLCFITVLMLLSRNVMRPFRWLY